MAAIIQGGEEDVAVLNEELARVEEGKGNFSNTVAEMETNFSDRMEEIVQDLEDAIQDMNLADDMFQIGENNIQGLINSTASMKLQLIAEYREMGRAAAEAYRREVEQALPSETFMRIGRYDIQGIIRGAETEKPKLAAAYEDAARELYLMAAQEGRSRGGGL